MTPYYEDEQATIYCGDCRDVMPHLPKVGLVLTDPPYGIGFAAQPTKWQRAKGHIAESWDDSAVVDLAPLLELGRVQVTWGGNYYSLPPSRGWLCWYKPDAPPSMGSFELAWTNQDRNSRLISCSISSTNAERVGHPTQKPLAVMLWTLQQYPECATVLDPFMGSGTTLVAAKRLGRRAIGIEIEERYCAIAVERLRQQTLFGVEETAPQPVTGDLFGDHTHRMTDAEMAVLGEQDSCREMALERAVATQGAR